MTKQHPDIPIQILVMIGGADTVVQAGGNCGLYTAQYASHVNEVLTFEPDLVNYHCLKENLKEYNNVTMHPFALGSKEAVVGIKIDRVNTGASSVSEQLDGKIKQVPLDNYDIDPDLIHLDIEGMEKNALEGMTRILKKYRPAVVVERNNGGDLLLELGYKKIANIGLDWLYV